MKIGFIGLGIMGESMCENIVKKHDDTVYCFDFIPAKVELLASKGAVPCKDSVELAEKSDVIISMVPKSEHSMSVYKTILPVLGAGKTCIDMSTIDPSVSVKISKMVKATGAAFMDAPVVKSKPAAIAGKLGIYMGGDEATCEAMRPILAYMGENIIRMGDNGKGLVMKICHNALGHADPERRQRDPFSGTAQRYFGGRLCNGHLLRRRPELLSGRPVAEAAG